MNVQGAKKKIMNLMIDDKILYTAFILFQWQMVHGLVCFVHISVLSLEL